MKKFLVSVSVVLALFSELSASSVVEIYSGKGSSCYENTTYQYHYDTLTYACIVTDTDGSQTLNVNGTRDPRYKNVSDFSYGPTGILRAVIKNGSYYTAMIGNYTSPQSQIYPTIVFDMSGNYSVYYQDLQGKYQWVYNGRVINMNLSSSSYLTNFSNSIVFMEGYEGMSDFWYYQKVYMGEKRILSEYSKIIFGGEFYRGKSQFHMYLAQRGETLDVLALSPNGTVKKLLTVAGTIDAYPNFQISSQNYQKFAFTFQKNNTTYIVTEK
jgi:hypothetical protein